MRKIAIANRKGGVGKMTTAVNLSLAGKRSTTFSKGVRTVIKDFVERQGI